MLRRLTLVLAVTAVFALCSLGVRTSSADPEAMATVTPDSGTLQTMFTFSASGLSPGHAVDIALFDAAGNRFTYQKNGVDQGIVIDDDGNAALQVTPATDLPSPAPGAWRAVFQEEETGLTATIPFDVGP